MPAIAYPLPAGLPIQSDLVVTLDGRTAGVGATPVAAYAIAAIDGKAEIEITARRPLAGAVIRPLARGIVPQINGTSLRFTVDRPGPLSIDLPGGLPLHLFLHPPADIPTGERVRTLAPGSVHDWGEMGVSAGETLHIPGGTALRGWVRASGAANVRITGHGIIDGATFPYGFKRTVVVDSCRDARIDGVTIIGSPTWTVVLVGCEHVTVERVNLIGWVVCSDGIDVVGSRDVTIRDCFLRDNDDCVAVKALPIDGIAAGMQDVERVLVERCVCWNDAAGNVFEIGFETRTARIADIEFRDCDVLGAHGEGGVFTIHAGDRALIENVRYRDIRVEHMYDRFIDLKILHSRYSKDAERGRIRNVSFAGIRTCHDPYNTVSLIGGFDAGHLVEDVRLKDVRIGDKVIASADDILLYTRFAKDISIEA